MKELGRETRVQMVGAAPAAQDDDEYRVLRVVRESLRLDPPVVRFEAAQKRCLGFFH